MQSRFRAAPEYGYPTHVDSGERYRPKESQMFRLGMPPVHPKAFPLWIPGACKIPPPRRLRFTTGVYTASAASYLLPSMRKARLPALISSFPFLSRSTSSVTTLPLRYRLQCLLSPLVSRLSYGFCAGAALPKVSLLRTRYPALANLKTSKIPSDLRCNAHKYFCQGRFIPPASSPPPTRSLVLKDLQDTEEHHRCLMFLFRLCQRLIEFQIEKYVSSTTTVPIANAQGQGVGHTVYLSIARKRLILQVISPERKNFKRGQRCTPVSIPSIF
ncbi:hypothetical protein C8F04DRAFT_1158656 [Mycena alexandri]|uniref:Uncharacterized protein n=1 Tax=Mycena alexandri TaxID=1745969 RepID=A0AAD6RXQ3_9AGAR|nr:hypothetical protein C8F04DRAFT_1158656 [Mycena alexandri]